MAVIKRATYVTTAESIARNSARQRDLNISASAVMGRGGWGGRVRGWLPVILGVCNMGKMLRRRQRRKSDLGAHVGG